MAHPYRSAGRAGAKSKFRAMLGTDRGAKHLNDDTVASPNAKVTSGIDDVKIMGKCPPARLDRARGGKVAKKGVTVNVIVPPAQPAVPPIPPMMKSPMPPPGGPAVPPPGMKPPMMPPPNAPVPGAGLSPMRARGGRLQGGMAVNRFGKEDKDGFTSKDTYKYNAETARPGQDVPLVKDQSRFTGRARGGKVHSDEAEDKKLIKRMIAQEEAKEKSRGGYIGGEPKSNKLKQWAQYARKNSYHKKDGGGIGKYPLTAGADSGVGRLQHSRSQRKHKD